ncbi:hypothetical protein V2J09_003374 [Rumex salicifolius]
MGIGILYKRDYLTSELEAHTDNDNARDIVDTMTKRLMADTILNV